MDLRLYCPVAVDLNYENAGSRAVCLVEWLRPGGCTGRARYTCT